MRAISCGLVQAELLGRHEKDRPLPHRPPPICPDRPPLASRARHIVAHRPSMRGARGWKSRKRAAREAGTTVSISECKFWSSAFMRENSISRHGYSRATEKAMGRIARGARNGARRIGLSPSVRVSRNGGDACADCQANMGPCENHRRRGSPLPTTLRTLRGRGKIYRISEYDRQGRRKGPPRVGTTARPLVR